MPAVRRLHHTFFVLSVVAAVAMWAHDPVAQVGSVAEVGLYAEPGLLIAPPPAAESAATQEGQIQLGPEGIPSFNGIWDTVAIPPSPGIAVGPNHLIQVVNSKFEIRTKTGGTSSSYPFSAFPWSSFDHSGSKAAFDPTVIYDHFADRWMMMALSKDSAAGTSHYLIAVSTTPDPEAAWCAYYSRADLVGGVSSGNWADNLQLGFDETNFYVTSNQHSFSTGAFVHARVRVATKSQFYSCGGTTWGDFNTITDPPFSIVPARTFGSPGVGYFVDAESATSGTTLRIRTITGTWPNPTNTPPVLSVKTAVTVDAYTASGDAPSLGSTTPIDTGDARLLNVVYRDGYLYTAHTVGSPCFDPATSSCARFYKIAVGGTPSVALQESVGTAGLFTFYPAIEPDPSGNIFLVFSRTGPQQYAESRYALRMTADSATQASRQLQAGAGPYTRLDGTINRWGTHGGAAVDPSDGTVWVVHQHAAVLNKWGTRIARLTLTHPGAFNLISPVDGATNQSTFPRLEWGASAGATSYETCHDTNAQNACSPWTNRGLTTAINLPNLAPGTRYSWHVRANNANGSTYANGSSTAWWNFTTSPLPGEFGKIAPLNGAAVPIGSVTLSWQASNGATSYRYCFAVDVNGTFCPGTYTSTNGSTSVTVDALPGRTYIWQVVADGPGGVTPSDSNTAWMFTTPGPFNDTFAAAALIAALPYKNVVDTTEATTTSEDPLVPCGASYPSHSVWYHFTPYVNGPITFNTFGSSYDTVLSVYTGSPGNFSPVACNDDSYTSQSSLTVQGTAGVRLSILVTAYWEDGGSLILNAFRPTRRLEVDLNGDGLSDVLTYDAATGQWTRQLSVADGGFSVQSQGTWETGWSIAPAQFDTNASTDFFLFNPTTGSWVTMLNDGSVFAKSTEGQWWPGWERHIMDLNGDGVSDVFLYDTATGIWFKCVRTKSGFTYSQGGWNPGWELYPMVLNNDGLDDLFLISRTTGRWFWALGDNGPAFIYPFTETWFNGWNLHPGDYNGDGRSDLLLHDPATGTYFTATNTGTGFTYARGGWSLGWKLSVGNFYPDDYTNFEDLFLHDPLTGLWFQLLSDGSGRFFAYNGQTWSEGWELFPMDFTGDRRTDMVLYHPVTGVWYQARTTSDNKFIYTTGTWAPGLTLVTRAPFR